MKANNWKINLQRSKWLNIFILFLIGSIVGTFYEEGLHFVKTGIWETRAGLIWGPFNPLYGIGFIIFVVFLNDGWNQRSKLVNFLMCSILGASVEVASSLIGEYLFNAKSWDYSNHFLNIFGRTTIPFAIFWGIGGFIIVEYIYPYLVRKLKYILPKTKKRFCLVMSIFMLVNLGLTTMVLSRYVVRNSQTASNNRIGEVIDTVYSNEYIEQTFPNWQFMSVNGGE